jgi:hypothetical protein
MPAIGKWPKFIEGIRGGRVLVTRSKVSDDPARKSGKAFARTGYLYVADVGQVEADDGSLRFKVKP